MSQTANKKIVVLISDKGTGTNLQAIIDGIESKKINGEIVAVISDTAEALGLERARKHDLPMQICKDKKELLLILNNLNPDFVCLAGWKQIILDEVIDNYPKKILNLHPGCIPDDIETPNLNPDATEALWNKGKLAEKAIEEFLNSGSSYASSSIHFLTKEFDFGPVLGRVYEKIQKTDNAESLYARLKNKENDLYKQVLVNLTNEKK